MTKADRQCGDKEIPLLPTPTPSLTTRFQCFPIWPVWPVQVLCDWIDAICRAAEGFLMAQSPWWDQGQSNEEELISPPPADRPSGASCARPNWSITHAL